MCGILGCTGEDKALLRRMSRTLRHRGPDDEGMWSDGTVSLGHTRLAIIDLTAAGHQPMRRKQLHITFNGEIYNYQSIREDLQADGLRFQTSSDTEVILAAYEQWGPDCVLRFNGQFAFCIYDALKKRLFFARDPFGQKPLYYSFIGGKLVFASEIKALLAAARGWQLNRGFVPYLLAYRYVPTSVPVFAGIHKFPAGSRGFYDLRTKQMNIERYWTLAYEPKLQLSFQSAARELRERTASAVQTAMVADVPVGVFLSGGLDSSCIAYHAAKASPQIQTFTIASHDPNHDESPYASLVAETFGTDHHTYHLRDRELIDGVRSMYQQYDTPYLSTSAVALYALAQRARKHVTVALSGEGGDEHFAGYTRTAWYRRIARIPRAGAPLVKALAHATGAALPEAKDRALAAARAMTLSGAQRYALIANPPDAEAQKLAPIEPSTLVLPYKDVPVQKDTVDTALAADIAVYLESDLLLKLDTSTMAHALEGRLPLLDPTLSAWAARLPTQHKIRNGQQKAVLAAAHREVLPKRILQRRKSGFGLPLREFMQEDGKALLLDSLSSDALLYAEKLVDEHVAQRAIHSFAQTGGHASTVYALFHLEQFLASLPEKAR